MGPLAWIVFLCIVSSASAGFDEHAHEIIEMLRMVLAFTTKLDTDLMNHRGEAGNHLTDSEWRMTASLNLILLQVGQIQLELANLRAEHGDSKTRITDKLDSMQHKFVELRTELAKQREEAARSQTNSDNSLVDIKRAVQNNFDSMRRLEDDVGRNFTLLQERSWQTFALLAAHTTTKANLLSYVPYRSCSDIRNAQSGAYIIQANDESNHFMAYCHREMMGGGIWLVIQNRFDGSLDFYRNWTEYRDGFGNIEQEFWIGLERLYQLTSGRPHELMVELRDFKGNYKFALYSAFEIGSEAEQYNLKTLGAYNGTAGDSLSMHSNMKFSTYDRDNDIDDRNCAELYEGAWWYNECFHSNLNGPYKNIVGSTSMNWYDFNNSYEGLNFSRMMIRPN